MINKELKKNLEKERKKQREDAIKINTFIRLDKSSASEIDKQIEQIYLSLQKNIKFVCTNKDLMNSMLDELKAVIQQFKELGWIEEEKQEIKQETNYEHYKDEIIEFCIGNHEIIGDILAKSEVVG